MARYSVDRTRLWMMCATRTTGTAVVTEMSIGKEVIQMYRLLAVTLSSDPSTAVHFVSRVQYAHHY